MQHFCLYFIYIQLCHLVKWDQQSVSLKIHMNPLHIKKRTDAHHPTIYFSLILLLEYVDRRGYWFLIMCLLAK